MLKLSRPQFSWILYDMANAAFALIVRTVFAPLFFKAYAASDWEPITATSILGLVCSAAGLLAGVLAPWLGSIADANSCRKRFLGIFLAVGLLSTVGLCFAGQGDAEFVLLLYFLSLVAYMGGNSFYDALLVQVSPRGSVHRLSSLAYAWGYVGGLIPFVLCMALTFCFPAGSFAGVKLAFLIAACWWGLLAMPLFRFVRETPPDSAVRRAGALDGFRRLWATAREISHYRNVLLFLIAYFLYIDGVGTIFMMATPISVDIGISQGWLLGTILALQLIGCPFTILYGALSRRFAARTLIYAGITTYILIAVLVGVIPFFASPTVRLWLFLSAAFLIGTAQGGIQSLSRSLFSKLIPAAKAAEFFGFYNIFGKFTTVLGPVLIFLAGVLWGRSEFGIALLIVPFVSGAWLLSHVKIPRESKARL